MASAAINGQFSDPPRFAAALSESACVLNLSPCETREAPVFPVLEVKVLSALVVDVLAPYLAGSGAETFAGVRWSVSATFLETVSAGRWQAPLWETH